MLIDNLDLKILYELDRNARAPYSAIAKKVGVSKQTVQKRIESLVSRHVVTQFTTIINMARFGIFPSQIYLSFNSCSQEEKKGFIESLMNNPAVTQASLCEGAYDLFFGIAARNQHEIDLALSNVCYPFASIIKTRKIVQFVDTRLFPRDHLIGKKRDINPMDKGFHSRQANPAVVKETDKGIIASLCQDPRISFTGIARKLNIPVQTIIQRVRFLEKEDVIRGYIYLLDEEIFMEHNVLLECSPLSNELEKRLFSYLANQPNVMFVAKTLGEFDFSINVETMDLKDYRKFAEDFKQAFAPQIKNFTPLMVTKFLKLSFMPKF